LSDDLLSVMDAVIDADPVVTGAGESDWELIAGDVISHALQASVVPHRVLWDSRSQHRDFTAGRAGGYLQHLLHLPHRHAQ